MGYCSHYACTRKSSFNIEGSKTAEYCEQHAEGGMVDILRKRCLHDSCSIYPSFNVEGSKTAAYCKQHAEDDMVNVRIRRCSHDSCSVRPSFNVEGNKTAAYCKQHADDGMVDVRARRCSHGSCIKRPVWGVLNDCAATVCTRHKSRVLRDPAINFRALCKVVGCRNVSRWGLDGRQPTHCHGHGPLMDGLTCTIGVARNKSRCPSPSHGPVKSPTFHVKTECLF